MNGPRTRRALLASAGTALATLAGCDGRSPGTGAPTESSPSGDTPTELEHPLTGGPDERVTTSPPGEPALSPDGSWPQYGFDAANTGYDPETAGITDVEAYWRLDGGETPVVADGSLFNVYQRDVQTKRLTRRDATTAAVTASTDLVEYGVTDPPAVDDEHVYVSTFVRPFAVDRDGDIAWRGPKIDGIDAPPTVGTGHVYVAGTGFESRGNPPAVASLTTDGETRWTETFERETVGAPAVVDDAVAVATNSEVVALGPDDGDVRWRYDPVTPAGTVAIAHGHVYVPGEDAVHAVDLADGTESWTSERGAESIVVTADAVVAGAGKRTASYDASTGEKRWTDHLGKPLGATGGVVYTADSGALQAVRLGDGERQWSYRTPEIAIHDQIVRHVDGIAPVGNAVYLRAADALHGLGPA